MPGKFSNLSRWSFYAESHRNAVLSGSKKRSSNLWLNYCSDRFLRKLGRWVLNVVFLSFTVVPQILSARHQVSQTEQPVLPVVLTEALCTLGISRPLQCALNRTFFGVIRRKSEQLPCVHATAFSWTNLFSDRYDWNKSYKPVIKHRRLENSISNVLIAFMHAYGTVLSFLREKVLQNDAKNNLIYKNAVA